MREHGPRGSPPRGSPDTASQENDAPQSANLLGTSKEQEKKIESIKITDLQVNHIVTILFFLWLL